MMSYEVKELVDCPHCQKSLDGVITQKAMTRKQTELLTWVTNELYRISDMSEKINHHYIRILKNDNWLMFVCRMVIAFEEDKFKPSVILSIMQEVLKYNVPDWKQEFNDTIQFRNSYDAVIRKVTSSR